MMRLNRFIPALVSCLILWSSATATISLTGCSGWKSGTYKTAGTVVITADVAMQAWAAHVVTGGATPEQEAKVRAAYHQYQTAMLAVLDAGRLATSSNDMSALNRWFAAAQAAQAHLGRVVNAFLPQDKRIQ